MPHTTWKPETAFLRQSLLRRPANSTSFAPVCFFAIHHPTSTSPSHLLHPIEPSQSTAIQTRADDMFILREYFEVSRFLGLGLSSDFGSRDPHSRPRLSHISTSFNHFLSQRHQQSSFAQSFRSPTAKRSPGNKIEAPISPERQQHCS